MDDHTEEEAVGFTSQALDIAHSPSLVSVPKGIRSIVFSYIGDTGPDRTSI